MRRTLFALALAAGAFLHAQKIDPLWGYMQINAYRMVVGLPTLKDDRQLEKAASFYLHVVMAADDLSHDLMPVEDKQSLCWKYTSYELRFENLGWIDIPDGSSDKEIDVWMVQDWWASIPHREAMIDPFVQYAGLVLERKGGRVWAILWLAR